MELILKELTGKIIKGATTEIKRVFD